ncbi:MAG: methyltransferase domain-containing protein [Chloroflexi bacterium]|nr:methyltransferase domain-containing protein [Chloroflexota bacterium]
MLKQRVAELEWMDEPDFGHREVMGTFRFLEPVNRWFGGIRPPLSFFQRESRAWDRHKTYRVLDVGCGAGDVPMALVRWSHQRGYRLQVDAIDQHAITVELAQKRCQGCPEISVFHQDVFCLNERKYDYVHASQFLHHFPDGKVVSVLKHLLGLSRRKLVINDLVRAPLHYASAWAFTLFASPVFRHDARLSIRKGFILNELERLLQDGGSGDFRLERHFFYRFLLIVNN